MDNKQPLVVPIFKHVRVLAGALLPADVFTANFPYACRGLRVFFNILVPRHLSLNSLERKG